MNLLDDDPTAPWQTDAYYLAARRRVVEHMGTAEISLIEINAGGQLLPHIQSRRTFYCCIRGEGTYILHEQEGNLIWGDVVEVAPRTIHAFIAKGNAPLYLLAFQALTDAIMPIVGWRDLLGKWTGRLT